MQLRETLLNLAITSVLVLIVALVAMLLRESRPGPVAAIPIAMAQPASETPGSRELTPDFQPFADVSLVVSRSNEADTLRISVGGKEEIFASTSSMPLRPHGLILNALPSKAATSAMPPARTLSRWAKKP